jgi:hypothetical protein
MRIGLDLDNTLVNYDHPFALEAKRQGMVSRGWQGSKKKLRDNLQPRSNGKRLWQTLQGRVYGLGMGEAQLFPGVASFLMRCRGRGDEIFIISHKTEFGHFDLTKTPLRKAALDWMESKKFFDENRFGLCRDRVFFTGTRSEKVDRIRDLKLDVFVDDLEEVFAEKRFPAIKKILFSRIADGTHHDLRCDTWLEIEKNVLGSLTDEELGCHAQTLSPVKVTQVQKIKGRGNSRLYQVQTEPGSVFALKYYPDLSVDPRPRLQTEVRACRFLENLGFTPRVVSFDKDLNLALYEWIDGTSQKNVGRGHLDQALAFIEKLKDLSSGSVNKFPQASEACLSANQIFSQLEQRIRKLESVQHKPMRRFLDTTLKPLFKMVRDWSWTKWPSTNIQHELPVLNQTLSPSDFGFHNTLQRTDESLCFVDLEYFGRDDPAKLMADFLWHPAMRLNDSLKTRWLKGMFKIFGNDNDLRLRFRAAWPLYGLRWALILLNEFRQDGWTKRLHANQDLLQERKQKLEQQLQKSSEVCQSIVRYGMECPYGL